MIDLIAEGRKLWEQKVAPSKAAEIEEVAEITQLRAFQAAEVLRASCGHPQSIRNEAATCKPRGWGKAAESAVSATPTVPAFEIETIIRSLRDEVGRSLGAELIDLMRSTMLPMSREMRAVLADDIDQCFERAKNDQQARQNAMALLERVAYHQPPCGLTKWLNWIEEHCPLLTDDRAHIAKCLTPMPSDTLVAAAQRYVQVWKNAASAESHLVRKDNTGRRAANASLLSRDDTILPEAPAKPKPSPYL